MFPSRCIICHKTVADSTSYQPVELCRACYLALPFNLNCCLRCALPLPQESTNDTLCGRCISKLPEFDYACSLFRYEDDVIRLVQQLKFAEKISYARSIGEMFIAETSVSGMFKQERPECLLPVPLHSSRLRQRGFNQAIEISRVLAKKLDLPIEYNAVVRQRSTSAQTGLNAKQRSINIKGAFSVSGGMPYRRVLIIDDVVTTGSTANELARVLKENKVERVGVLSIARAPIKS